MNIDMRNIDSDFENAINEVMKMYGYSAATKAIVKAVSLHKKQYDMIDELKKELRDTKEKLFEEKEVTKKTIKYIKFFKNLGTDT